MLYTHKRHVSDGRTALRSHWSAQPAPPPKKKRGGQTTTNITTTCYDII